jgi:hypothetical protein
MIADGLLRLAPDAPQGATRIAPKARCFYGIFTREKGRKLFRITK